MASREQEWLESWLQAPTEELVLEIVNGGTLTLTTSATAYTATFEGDDRSSWAEQRIEVTDPDLRMALARLNVEMTERQVP